MPNVILPGIREIFPEYLTENHPRPKNKVRSKTMQSSASRPSSFRSGSPGFPALHHFSPRPSSSTVSHVSLSDPRQVSSIAPSFPAQGHPLSGSPTMSNFDTHSTRKRSNSDSVFYSFDILRSDPSSPSLQHVASSATYPSRGAPPSSNNSCPSPGDGSTSVLRVAVAAIPGVLKYSAAPPHERGSTPSPVDRSQSVRMRIDSDSGPGRSSMISFPVFGCAVEQKNYSGNITDSDDDELSASNTGKRHVCPTCLKRFNRPSSLKIHVNMHTGATPFRCPWPECGREFNVNSNMRRHYRNHTIPGSKGVDQGRRRRRVPTSGLVGGDVAPAIHVTLISSMDSASISNRSGSSEESDDCDRLHYVVEEPTKISKTAQVDRASRYYSQSHIRTLRLKPEDRSASPSLSPSPSPNYVYSPSAPYVRSFMDPTVSTALRPAFRPLPFGDRFLKEEQTTETW